jgi:glycosyltransferase involved in cell wall biosynthesis
LQEPCAHVVMVGDGSLRKQITTYIREHALEGRVWLLGHRDDVPECLAASDVFVLSSNWEGNPLAVMEAMAAGLPVIGTAVGGVPELVQSGQQGILVPPGDYAAFVNAMRNLVNSPELRAAMGKAAFKHATAAFNVDRMAEGYASLYRNALNTSSLETTTAAAA